MTPARRPRPIHVERTTEPAIMRWVCHHPALASTAPGRRRPPLERPLGTLLAEGSITEIRVDGGNICVRAAAAADWPTLAPRLQIAILAELDALDSAPDHWLTESCDDAPLAPSITEIQQIVDRAAGAAMTNHGGAIIVAAVDHGTVSLRPEGTCNGCGQIDSTIVGLIEPAVRSAYPSIVEITFGAAAGVDIRRRRPLVPGLNLSLAPSNWATRAANPSK